MAPVALVSPAKIVVLAAAAYPAAIWEVEFLFLDFFLSVGLRGVFEIVDHDLIYLHGWELRNGLADFQACDNGVEITDLLVC